MPNLDESCGGGQLWHFLLSSLLSSYHTRIDLVGKSYGTSISLHENPS